MIKIFFLALAIAAAEPPETVLSHFYPKEGKDPAQLERVLRDNIAIMKKLDVIEPAPVVLVRERDHFVMLFTWRGAGIPDNPPAEIKKNWDEMNALARIEFEEVTPLVMK